MESLLFKNIAGRCGRAGQFTEGDTIIFDNPVGDAQLERIPLDALVCRKRYSSRSSRACVRTTCDQSIRPAGCTFNGRLPAVGLTITENPGVDDLAVVTSSNIVSLILRMVQTAAAKADSCWHSTRFSTGHTAESPLRLPQVQLGSNPFGEAASNAGFSRASGQRHRSALGDNLPTRDHREQNGPESAYPVWRCLSL